jgi:hypothetical protein
LEILIVMRQSLGLVAANDLIDSRERVYHAFSFWFCSLYVSVTKGMKLCNTPTLRLAERMLKSDTPA